MQPGSLCFVEGIKSLSLRLHTNPTDAHTLVRRTWRYEECYSTKQQRRLSKASLPLCRNDANPPVFTVMCQPEQSLSQNSLFILSLFLPHSLWRATNFSVCQKITLLLRETAHGGTAHACCSRSCRITNININTNNNIKTPANKFQAALTSPSQWFEALLPSSHPRSFFKNYIYDAKTTAM